MKIVASMETDDDDEEGETLQRKARPSRRSASGMSLFLDLFSI